MKFSKLSGGVANKDVTKYQIKWAAKSRSNYQRQVKEFLKPYWLRQMVYEEFPVVGTKMTLDIVNLTKRIALEIQGEQHGEFNAFFHKGEVNNYWNQLGRDADKREWCELNNLRLVEIFPKDLPLTEEFLKAHDLL